MLPRPVATALLAILLLAPVVVAQETGRRVEFPATRFDDTLFASVDTTYRVAFDEDGDVWYTTQAGLVHVDVEAKARRLFTKMDGLPSSYALGLAVGGGKVYVGTDLGLAVVDRATGDVEAFTPDDSPLKDALVQEVALDGDRLWIGHYFEGVAVWNLTSDEWAYKNTSTTATYGKPVRRIVPTAEHVWVATDGDGVWRHDRAAGPVDAADAWEVLLKVDGLPSNDVLSVAERGANVYFGTSKGLARWAGLNPQASPEQEWLVYNESHGLPHERVLDVDVVPTASGSLDVFAATREGGWQLEVETGESAVRAQSFGILGDYVFDSAFDPVHGWAFATQRGVSLLRDGAWSYYTTGASTGASMGPIAFHFTSASVGDSEFLWFGSAGGVSAFAPTHRDGMGAWYNLGEWQYYPGSTVNWIDSDEGMTWIGTNRGVFGFDPATGEWVPKLARAPSRNLVYGLDADRGELWIALFGDGLLWQDLETNETRAWDGESANPLPDLYLTDVRVQGDDVWLGAGSGVIRLNRVAGTVTASYGAADGIPGSGIVYRLLPDGAHVYVGTKDGGVGRLSVATGQVDRSWNATTHPGFPGGEIRSLHREGGRLWVGTTEGLARVDLATNEVRSYSQADSGLVQNYVNGITSRDGILYLATLSGVARLDVAADAFLPMQLRDGEAASGTTVAPETAPVVRIASPQDGRYVAGPVTISGTASRFGGAVDRVEVRIGDGEWRAASGAESWTYEWDTSGMPVNEAVPVAARAIAGNQTSRVEQIVLTVVEIPETPLTVSHEPVEKAVAGRPIVVRAAATGDEPLTVTAYYKRAGEGTYARTTLARQGDQFVGAIPASAVKEGELLYYVEAKSGLPTVTSPEDPARPHSIEVGPQPRLAVDVQGPEEVVAHAGAATTFDLNVTNVGTEPATFLLSASGLRASWLQVAAEPLELDAGETRAVRATVTVPAAAFADTTSLNFEVADSTGVAERATAVVPLRVVAAAVEAPVQHGETQSEGGFVGVPGPAAPLVALALVGAALVLRRRSA